jgi:primosomal protein N' (replication factor Y) (superfamily II helicase)
MQELFPNEIHSQAQQRLSVCLPVNVHHCFDYLAPEGESIAHGAYVTVSFSGRNMMGVVWGEGASELPASKLKTILCKHSHIPPMPETLRHLLEKAARYNCASLGNMLRLAMPVMEGMAKAEHKRWRQGKATAPQPSEAVTHAPKTLTLAQTDAAQTMIAASAAGFQPFLLDGATGAGKTEVFFEVAEAVMREGKQVLILLPEIALSVPLVMRAEARFGFTPTLWHSSETPAKRRNALASIMRGTARLIIGARSALFLPYAALGLIVVDEEHDGSFKQEGSGMHQVLYHGRDMAVLRAREEHLPIILSSATPSLETHVNAECGKYHTLHLTRREGQAALPTIHLIDMKREKMEKQRWLSPTLQRKVTATLARGEQSLLFINRRGYAPLVLCRACGYRYECPSCSAWLVYHASKARLQCHHCGLSTPLPPTCPSCGADKDKLTACGPGVERIAEEAAALFPSARICVLSGDTTDDPTTMKAMLETAMRGEVDIIVGTQLLAKGHHFPHLTMVGVVDADAGLQGGDIRAAEKTYQLLHQLAGRAGREEQRGEVYVQTYRPDHPLMQALAAWNREGFIALELQGRVQANMPPYGRLCAVIVEGKPEESVVAVAKALAVTAPNLEGVRILGPAPAPLYKLRNCYRYRFLIIAPKRAAIQSVMKEWCAGVAGVRGVDVRIDIDPVSFV